MAQRQRRPREAAKPARRPDVQYPLLQNGLDYLVDVVDRLSDHHGEGQQPDARTLKYAVLHLQAGVEVLLKARLQQEHWSLVFKKPEAAAQVRFASGDFESCGTEETITRLRQIVGLTLADKGVESVKKLGATRNALQHYGLTASAGAVEARTAEVLNFLLPFIDTHLLPGLDDQQTADVRQTMQVVRSQLRGIESYVTTRMNELRAELKDVQSTTVVCPECDQQALVLGRDLPVCRFCLATWQDPAQAAEEYAWMVLGLDGAAPGDEENPPVRICPDCSSQALVMEAVTAEAPEDARPLCFACGESYANSEFGYCAQGCGTPLPAESEDLICSDCEGIALGRF
ncbi:hypothetical protein ACPC54_18480 [Kitasatospora sp. NPDC094028]